MSNWTILKLIEWTTEYFTKYEVPNPRLDAELLLSSILQKKRMDLYLMFDKLVSEKELADFKVLIQRRAKREPLQFILGEQNFCGLNIKVTPDVLIPRPETEILVDHVSKLLSHHLTTSLSHNLTILDLCTGSGCIIAALADALPTANFVGIDVSLAALEVARQNTEKWHDRVTLLHGDLFGPLSPPPSPSPLEGEGRGEGKFDLIVSNPPYISPSEYNSLQTEVRDFEPKLALVAEDNGLAIIKKIIKNAPAYLNKGGHILIEVGEGHAEEIRKFAPEIETIKDYSGVERIILLPLR